MRLVALRRRSRAVAVLAGLVLAVLLPQGTASASDPITDAWTATGGASGPLGAATGAESCTLPNGGCSQTFEHGTYYWSAATLAHWVPAGPITTAYAATGGVSGALGWPWRNPICDGSGGCRQLFQQGWIAGNASTGTHVIPYFVPATPGIDFGGWWSYTQVGYPTGDVVCGLSAGGCRQSFERGTLWGNPRTGGAFVISPGPLATYWTAHGGEASTLGYPTSEYVCDTSGAYCWQKFDGFSYITVSAAGVIGIPGRVGGAWGGSYGPTPGIANPVPSLGMPVAEATCLSATDCEQHFSQGTLVSYKDNTPASLKGAIATYYDAVGALSSPLIAPRAEQYATAGGGQSQFFWGSYGGAEVHWSPATGAHAVLYPITSAYDPLMGESGLLGYPVTEQYPTVGGGVTQLFQSGGIHSSPATGTYAVLTAIAQRYDSMRGESGVLGYPTTSQYATPNSGATQQFQHGGIHWSPATGAHAVVAPIAGVYDPMRGESGALGYPVTEQYATAGGGWTQIFQNGGIHWSPATGGYAVLGAIAQRYDATRGESGPLGYPVGAQFCGLRNGGCGQHFQGGSIYWSPATGAHVVTDPIRAYWAARYWEGGPLGYPTSDTYAWTGGYRQNFQGGVLFWNTRTGVVSKV